MVVLCPNTSVSMGGPGIWNQCQLPRLNIYKHLLKPCVFQHSRPDRPFPVELRREASPASIRKPLRWTQSQHGIIYIYISWEGIFPRPYFS